MSQKYPRPEKRLPSRPEKQHEFEDKVLDLKMFNFIKENLEVKIERMKEGNSVHVVTICLKNPISGEIEEICKDYV